MNFNQATRLASLVYAVNRNGTVKRLFQDTHHTDDWTITATLRRFVQDAQGTDIPARSDQDVMSMFVEADNGWHYLYWPVVALIEEMDSGHFEICISEESAH